MFQMFAMAAALLTLAATPASAQMGGDSRFRPPPCSDEAPCATIFEQSGLFGVRNAAGEITIPPRFHHAQLASARFGGAYGLILTFNQSGRMGFVGRDGREISPPRYTRPESQAGAIMVSVDGNEHTMCAFDFAARQILPCEFTGIFSGDVGFVGHLRGARRWFDRAGNETGTPQVVAQQDRRDRAAAAARPAQQSQPTQNHSRARGLADGRNWDEALNAAIRGTPEDQAYVLLAFYRNGGVSDTRYGPMLGVLSANRSIFESAMRGATAEQRSQLATMQRAFNDYQLQLTQGPGSAKNGSGYISGPRTVGECHGAGGSVSLMGYCRR